MAITVTPLSAAVSGGLGTIGGRKVWIGVVALDSSYPTGGWTVDPTLFGMVQIDQILFAAMSPVSTSLVRFTPAAGGTGKVQAFVATTGAETANATNFSANSVACIVIGV